MHTYDTLLNALATLMVTIDPAGLAPLFLALTSGMDRHERGQVAIRASVIAVSVLILFAVAGTGILKVFGITIGAFRVAGGMLLFWIAFEMIFERRQERHEKSAERAITNDMIRNIAVFPLAIPLVAGPGSISATILLTNTLSSATERLMLVAIIVFSIAVVYVVFLLADRVDHVLGETGRTILTRLLGVILAALAVQFVADGVRTLINHG